jgi:hypothetical protein
MIFSSPQSRPRLASARLPIARGWACWSCTTSRAGLSGTHGPGRHIVGHRAYRRGRLFEPGSAHRRGDLTPVYDRLRSQLFALGLLTSTGRASVWSFGASNSLIRKGLCGAQDRNRTSDTVIFSEAVDRRERGVSAGGRAAAEAAALGGWLLDPAGEGPESGHDVSSRSARDHPIPWTPGGCRRAQRSLLPKLSLPARSPRTGLAASPAVRLPAEPRAPYSTKTRERFRRTSSARSGKVSSPESLASARPACSSDFQRRASSVPQIERNPNASRTSSGR